MSETKVFNVPDGNNSIDPALMMALSQNGGFGLQYVEKSGRNAIFYKNLFTN